MEAERFVDDEGEHTVLNILMSDLLTQRTFHVETLRRGAKVGRNQPCPCGSGKKYKKCCWLKEEK